MCSDHPAFAPVHSRRWLVHLRERAQRPDALPVSRPDRRPRTGPCGTPAPRCTSCVSAVFHYLGPSFAVLLFARVEVLGVAWLRIASAAVIFALWRRPWHAFAPLDRDRVGSGRLGRGAGDHERLLLRGDQPPAARHRRGHRVPAGDRAGRGRRRSDSAQSGRAGAGRGRRLSAHRRSPRGAALGFAFAFANAGLFSVYIVLADRVAKRPE